MLHPNYIQPCLRVSDTGSKREWGRKKQRGSAPSRRASHPSRWDPKGLS